MRALVLLAAVLATAGPAAAQQLVAIDAGHGGPDRGAVGVLAPGTITGLPDRVDAKGRTLIYEKDVNLDVAHRLNGVLQAQGFATLMTRTTDAGAGDRPFPGTSVDLRRRTEMANAAGAGIFVSLHQNALSAASTGTESYHFYVASPESRALALAVHQDVVVRLALPDRGIKQAGFYVLKHTVMPAVLVEGAFLSNPREAALLAAPDFRQALAEGIGAGVARFASGIVAPPAGYATPQTASALTVRYWVSAGVRHRKRDANALRTRLARRKISAVVRQRTRPGGQRIYLVVTGQFIQLGNARAMRDRLRRLGYRGNVTAAPAPRVSATSVAPPALPTVAPAPPA